LDGTSWPSRREFKQWQIGSTRALTGRSALRRPAGGICPEPAATCAGFDAGLRKHMLSVYNYMASGVLLDGHRRLAVVVREQRRSPRASSSGAAS
jgi:hypothetical protein